MSLLFALAFSLSGMIGAIAVDAATLYHARRTMQATVDLAALTAAGAPRDAQTIVREVLADAGYAGDAGLDVVVGRFEADRSKAAGERFVPGGEPANAVLVTLERRGALYFAQHLVPPPTLGARSLATVTPDVSFSLGSRLVSLNGGMANALLGALLGTTVSLTALDYNRLAAARIDALGFLDALAQKLSIEAVSYDELLSVDASAGDIAAALAELVSGSERATLLTLANAGRGKNVPMGKLFDLGRYGRLGLDNREAVVGADLSVLEVLSAAAALAGGDRQVWLSLGGSLPGIASLTTELLIGEPAQGGGWFALGPVDTVVRTAQVRLRIEAQFLGGLVLQNAAVRLPLWLDIAHAEAHVVGATCPDSAHPNGSATIAVRPGPLALAVGRVSNAQLRDFGTPLPVAPVRILDAALLKIGTSARVEVTQTGPVVLDFSSDDIGAARLRTARTGTMVSSLTQSLLNGLNLDITILGLGLSPANVIAQALRSLLAPLAAPLDAVINGLLTALGLGVGEADVRVYGVRCATPVLVG
ncbi:hypothetical protein DMC47_01560 [Nostoc sp. 3335mG]|nr:hypothetical protein DMC47_01560 [Nostoc sp. 3335mG]